MSMRLVTQSSILDHKNSGPKFPQNGGSTPTPCLDKAMHAQRGGAGDSNPVR